MISIIIPVYNAEKYIDRCINSIQKQSYKDWELIIVDDCSIDKSYDVCIKYAKNNKQISVFKQKFNQGSTKARQLGWKKAKGEWITFIDADDYIPIDALQHLSSKISDATDIIIGMMSTFQIKEDDIPIEEYRKRCINGEKIDVGPCAKLYRNKLYDDSIFDIPREINIGEDNLMNIRLSFKTEKKVCFVNQVVYIYDISNENSLIHKHRKSLQYEEIFHQYRILSIPDEQKKKYIPYSIGNRLYQLLRIIKENPFNTNWRESKFVKELLVDIEQNRYPINKSIKLLFHRKSLIIQLLWIIYSKYIDFKLNKSKL